MTKTCGECPDGSGHGGRIRWLGAFSIPFGQWFAELRTLHIPIGAVPVALAAVVLFYYAWQRSHDRVKRSLLLKPLAPFHEVVLAYRSPNGSWQAPSLEGAAPPPPSKEPGATGAPESPSEPVPAPSEGHVVIWRKESVSTTDEPWTPDVASFPPPAATPFARNVLAGFVILVVTLIIFRHAFFMLYDIVVNEVGKAIYFPLVYPTQIPSPALNHLRPDYIFLAYFSFMLAYLLASGLFTTERFRSDQRQTALALFLLYLPAAVVSDVVPFTFPPHEAFVQSASLLIRGGIGGAFLGAMVLSTLQLPRPVDVKPERPAEPGIVSVFFLSALTALLFAGVLLYFVFRYLGIGGHAGPIPIGILLLLPLVALTIWAVIGRAVYGYYLRQRPIPSVRDFHPKVSILIPAYNEAQGLEATIRAADLAAAGYPGATEILVGNDGSTDKTLEVARRAAFSLAHAEGTVVDLPHGGKSNVLNALLRVASGEIIIRIDADTLISETIGFAEVVPHFADPDVGGVQGLLFPLQEEGWTRQLRLVEVAWNHLFIRRATMGFRACQVVDGAFCAFRRRDLLAAGGWVAWNGEDTEITLRLQRKGYRMRLEPNAAAFEDVPGNYAKLERQRVRWNRGGIYAHYRHLYPSLAGGMAFGGLAILYWAALFVRSGLRSALYVYVALAALFLPTIIHVGIILALLLIPRSIVIGYYLVRYHRGGHVGWAFAWPVFSVIKQQFSVKSFGTMFPGEAGEFV